MFASNATHAPVYVLEPVQYTWVLLPQLPENAPGETPSSSGLCANEGGASPWAVSGSCARRNDVCCTGSVNRQVHDLDRNAIEGLLLLMYRTVINFSGRSTACVGGPHRNVC